MIDEFNIDETIDLTKLMEIVDARETKVFTVEDYVATKEKLGFEELKHMSVRFYGSHEYDNFVCDFIEDICKLKHDEKFELIKSLYCTAKKSETLADILQGLVKTGGVPEKERENIRKNYKPIVYRGYNELNNKNGYSYTTDFEMAKWFANRFRCFGKKGYVTKIDVDIDDIVFYYDGRGEKEMFIKESSLSEKIMEIIDID